MGSFQQGFALGAQIWDASEKNRLLEEAAEREKARFGREQEQWRSEDAYKQALSDSYKDKNWTGGVGIDEAVARGINFKQGEDELGGTSMNQGIDVSGGNFQKALSNPNIKASDVQFSPEQQRDALAARLRELTPAQQQAALRAYGMSPMGARGEGAMDLSNAGVYRDASGAIRASNEGTKRTDAEASAALLQQMKESGNAYGIQQANALRKGALEMTGLERGERAAKAEEEFSTWMQDQMKSIQADPVKWAQDNLASYNKPTKGSRLDDGNTAEIVQGVDANGQPVHTFVQRDKKGNGIFAAPVNQTTAMDALQHMAFEKYQSLPGKFKDAEAMRNQRMTAESGRTTAEAASRNAGVHEKWYGETYPAEMDKNRKSAEKIAGINAANRNTANYTPIGQDTDGAIVSYDRSTGKVSREDGKPIQDRTLFKKTTGQGEGPDAQTLRDMGIVQGKNGKYYRQGNTKKGEPEWVETTLPGVPNATDEALSKSKDIGGAFAPKNAPAKQEPAKPAAPKETREAQGTAALEAAKKGYAEAQAAYDNGVKSKVNAPTRMQLENNLNHAKSALADAEATVRRQSNNPYKSYPGAPKE